MRFFLVYGPDQDLNRLLPQVILNSFKNKKFPTTKGDQYCDFCFVDDVVEAIFKALNIRNASGKIFNIGILLPHPRLHERKFVLEPLQSIEKNWKHPKYKIGIREMKAKSKDNNFMYKI